MNSDCSTTWTPPAATHDFDQRDSDPAEPGDEPGDPPPSATSATIALNFLAHDVEPPIEGWLDDHLARIAAMAGVCDGQLTVALVDDAHMIQLHQQYKGQAATTDVLTFDLRDDPADPIEADLLICVDEAVRQANERGHETRLEVLLYAVHGLLHLIGYDDHNPHQATEMHRREDELLTQVGLGPVYHGRGTDP